MRLGDGSAAKEDDAPVIKAVPASSEAFVKSRRFMGVEISLTSKLALRQSQARGI